MLKNKYLKYKLYYIILDLLLWTVVFCIFKILFLYIYSKTLQNCFDVIIHGLPLDISIASYLSTVPALILTITSWIKDNKSTNKKENITNLTLKIWIIFSSIIVATALVVNIALYSYWHFPLDATPIFFISSSPKDAFASIKATQLIGGLISIIIITYIIFWTYMKINKRLIQYASKSISFLSSLVMVIMLCVLFILIRGGVTVSSMNTGKAYFSNNQILNHAAVNPILSFMESITHEKDFADMYRFMSNHKAKTFVKPLITTKEMRIKAKPLLFLSTKTPDIYLIIMESFSDTITKIKNITPNINALKKDAIYFKEFYANSFRTDRGLLSILHGYPAPATVSLMKFPKKTAVLPSIPKELKQNGWELKYYYGGDADFTNMRSFLINQGFKNIIEDTDFPISQRLSKWGVPDHILFKRVEEDVKQDIKIKPTLRVIQTSSSHEPFDVPYNKIQNKALNAFAYTDKCIGQFVKMLKSSNKWKNSLIILVPDHLGAWPKDINDFTTTRFHIPMIWTGGVIKKPCIIDTFGSQQDIAATLLGELGLNYDSFFFSKNLFNKNEPHFAFFMMNDGFGLIDKNSKVIFDNKRGKDIINISKNKNLNLNQGKAYTQILFNSIASL